MKTLKKEMKLSEFNAMGGNIDNLDHSQIKSTYYDKNQNKGVEKIVFSHSNELSKIYTVKFVDGTSHNYAEGWLKILVDLILDPKYTN